MTREERELSIEYLECIKENFNESEGYEYYAIENAIKALRQGTVIDKIKEVVTKWKADNFTDGYAWDCMKEIADIVDKAER